MNETLKTVATTNNDLVPVANDTGSNSCATNSPLSSPSSLRLLIKVSRGKLLVYQGRIQDFQKKKGGVPTSAEGASFLGGSGGMLPQKFLGI